MSLEATKCPNHPDESQRVVAMGATKVTLSCGCVGNGEEGFLPECGICHENKPAATWCPDPDGTYAVCAECNRPDNPLFS